MRFGIIRCNHMLFPYPALNMALSIYKLTGLSASSDKRKVLMVGSASYKEIGTVGVFHTGPKPVSTTYHTCHELHGKI